MRKIALCLLLAACTGPTTPPDAALADAGAPDGFVIGDAPGTDAPPGDAPSSADAPAPATDAPPPDVRTPEGFAVRVAQITCEALARCPRCPAPLPDCVERSAPAYRLEPAARFHADDAGAYIDMLEEAYASCEQFTPHEYRTLWPYWGPGETTSPEYPYFGDTCMVNADCRSRLCQRVIDPSFGDLGARCVEAPAPSARQALCR